MVESWQSMIELLLIGGSAGLGAVTRYAFAQLGSRFSSWKIPWMTYLVNILGSFLIGLLFVRFAPQSENYKIFATGFCGGLTTFSTYNFELFAMLEDHEYKTFAEYFLLSYGLGFLALILGILLGNFFS